MSLQNFKKAILIAGNQIKLAEKIRGGKSTTIAVWIQRKYVPPERVIDVCAAVGFAVSPHELNPIFYPHPDDALPVEYRGLQIKHDEALGRRSNDRRHRNVIINNSPENPDSS